MGWYEDLLHMFKETSEDWMRYSKSNMEALIESKFSVSLFDKQFIPLFTSAPKKPTSFAHSLYFATPKEEAT
jgi:hypothetical protein